MKSQTGGKHMKAIILAAGVGKRLSGITENPKCLLKIGEVILIERYLKALVSLDIFNISIVAGYKKETIVESVRSLGIPAKIKFIENPDFTKGSILSLYQARNELDSSTLIMDADVYFEVEILNQLQGAEHRNSIAIDTTSHSHGEEMMVGVKRERILDMRRDLPVENYDTAGEAVGFYKIDRQAGKILKELLEQQIKLGKHDFGYEDILPLLFEVVDFKPVAIDGLKWVEIDFEEDIQRAEILIKG